MKAAAEYLGVCPNTPRNWDRENVIPVHRHPTNGYRLFLKSDLEGHQNGYARRDRPALGRRYAELYLAEGEGHGFVNIAPWNFISSRYAADFFMRAGVMYKAPLPMVPPGELRKYDGEPIETILIKTNVNPTRQKLEGRGRKSKTEEPSPPKGPAASKG